MAKGNIAGLAYAQVWRTDANGRMAGTEADPDNITANTTTHALLLTGAMSNDIADPERQRVVFQGDDGVLGSMYFGPNDLPEGTFTMSTYDTTLWTMAMGGNVVTDYGNTIFSTNPNKKTPNVLGLAISRQAQDRDSGSDGTNIWLTTIYKVQLVPRNPAAAFQEAAEVEMQITPLAMDRYPNGLAFGATESWTDNKTYSYNIEASYPLAFTTYVQNGSATTYTTGYRPISTTVANGDFPNFHCVNNAQVALDSIVTTTGVATLAAAGTSGQWASLVYETEFTAI